MTQATFQADPTPWYRQFWPWFVFALPACVVVAGITMIVIANRHADDLVVDEYYKTGLAINRELEKRERAETLGLAAGFEISGASVAVTVTGPVADQVLTLRLSHPLEANRDFTVALQPLDNGRYVATLREPVGPRWHWILEPAGESAWRLDGVLSSPDFARSPPG